MSVIPVSIAITTLNEAPRVRRCIEALSGFAEVVVVDSGSRDGTANIAIEAGASVVDFKWDGQYPKKRQWCLENIDFVSDWIFFVDADEIVTDNLKREIAALFEGSVPDKAGYFITARYIRDGYVFKHGLQNKKLALINKEKMMFPVIDDLSCPGMGEIEGHYQPVLKPDFVQEKIGYLRHKMLHDAYENDVKWHERHKRYAAWESCMNAQHLWPEDPVRWRQVLKRIFRALPCRGAIAFLHSYIIKLGILDGKAGLKMALDRRRYYRMISDASKKKEKPGVSPISFSVSSE